MLNSNKLDDLTRRVLSVLPKEFSKLPEGLEAQIKDSLQTALHKMDLVTREEFDAQVRVLKRTREKLSILEEKLSQHHNGT